MQIDRGLGRPRIGVLDLDVHEPAPADVEHDGQGRDLGEGPAEVGRGQLAQHAGRGLGVVAHHQHAVGGAMDVELDAVGPPVDGRLHRGNRVLRRQPVGTSVREHEHPAHHASDSQQT